MNSKELLDYNVFRETAKKYNLDFIALFGSYYNGIPNENSDIDLIIDAQYTLDFDKIEEIKCHLKNIFKRNIDIMTTRQVISSLICGYVWRLKEYEVIFSSEMFNE